MLLSVLHQTTYRYAPAVELAQHMAHLKLRDTPAQHVLETGLAIEPMPATLQEQRDAFGNLRSYFTIEGRHQTLQLRAASRVRTREQAPPLPAAAASVGWEQVREHFRFRAGAPYDAAVEFSFASPHVQADPAFAALAQKDFLPGRALLDASCALMRRIHRDMRYVSQSTDVHTPAQHALQRGEGVCQDFAHIFLSCLRQLGLAARYVSGYLLTTPPPGQARLLGADASHAWVAVWLPLPEGEPAGAGIWVDLDPTNDRWGVGAPGADYITLAWGRDYSDVSPLRGVIRGGARHQLEVAVTVQGLPEDLPS